MGYWFSQQEAVKLTMTRSWNNVTLSRTYSALGLECFVVCFLVVTVLSRLAGDLAIGFGLELNPMI
jgi:hypothetical protein